MLTTQQTTDLSTWLENQEEALPESLANILVGDCLDYIFANKIERLGLFKILYFNNSFNFGGQWVGDDRPFNHQIETYKILIIQTLLSRSSEGQAVMSFLDVNCNVTNTRRLLEQLGLPKFELISCNLTDILSMVFSWLLHEGKTLDEALEIITKIYLVQRYATLLNPKDEMPNWEDIEGGNPIRAEFAR